MTEQTTTLNIGVVIFHEAQVLDITGPHEVFSSARVLQQQYGLSEQYRVFLIAKTRTPVTMSSGMQLMPDYDFTDCPADLDTLIVPGAENIQLALDDAALLAWIAQQSRCVRRLVSICTGAFLLARLGLLNGKNITTHWAYCADMQQQFPQLNIESDAIFIKQGNTYTSAGVTAGMDLSLALVEEDAGKKIAMSVARKLVVFYKRPGGQKQFSEFILSQSSSHFSALIDWILDNLSADLSIEILAERANMSPRHFNRKFKSDVGETPAKFVERLRLCQARMLLENKTTVLKSIADKCGFKSEEQMRRAFQRELCVTPNEYRVRF
ncbi:GlxA family transcriptional regulator [Neptuniibacter sp. CAU 1671]|uniref:GlxA family transcriptional regulator n=1 Tax=Neptuniibacter sp. CAU 1671 TaxID=3032593 RepID=UPI0023DA7315|nr:GlxA family transcriptional regulator [Neptuniibacter sp. CAU 1671]MDF2181155.1 GlxA family transcriptional regulator [Neptuniibacter sp. CAU 1671]